MPYKSGAKDLEDDAVDPEDSSSADDGLKNSNNLSKGDPSPAAPPACRGRGLSLAQPSLISVLFHLTFLFGIIHNAYSSIHMVFVISWSICLAACHARRCREHELQRRDDGRCHDFRNDVVLLCVCEHGKCIMGRPLMTRGWRGRAAALWLV